MAIGSMSNPRFPFMSTFRALPPYLISVFGCNLIWQKIFILKSIPYFITKKMRPIRNVFFNRNIRTAIGHTQTVDYIVTISTKKGPP